MALTTVSIAKSAHYLSLPIEEREAFSMADVKTQRRTAHLSQQIIA
jgi:hypothetical protein